MILNSFKNRLPFLVDFYRREYFKNANKSHRIIVNNVLRYNNGNRAALLSAILRYWARIITSTQRSSGTQL